jgi:hypothetical protein
MPNLQKQLIALGVLAPALAAFALTQGNGDATSPEHTSTTRAALRAQPTSDATSRPRVPTGDVRSYAVAVPELGGLAPDAPPGTHLDLWVAWEPPVTKRPQFRLLIRGVVLDRIVPPVTPDGPTTALLLVRAARIPDLLYADRWGQLNVTAQPDAG